VPIKNQRKAYRKDFMEDGKPVTIIATVRHDDDCGNGHETFSITANRYESGRVPGEESIEHRPSGKRVWLHAYGCLHDDVAKYFPQLAPFIKWHLCSTDGPLHYVANTIWHAQDRDCWGGKAGEVRWWRYDVKVNGALVYGHTGKDAYKLPEKEEAEKAAARIGGEIVRVPWMLHEGKAREFDLARSCAVWPEATDEQLSLPKDQLKALLEARLPGLLVEFRKAVESLGLKYQESGPRERPTD
jgi:uncharacterized protein Usg